MLLNWIKYFPSRVEIAIHFFQHEGKKSHWNYSEVRFPLKVFGYRPKNDLSKYFEGESSVVITNLQELCDWLVGCEYTHYNAKGEWKHPLLFENERNGNCIDHSLWTWRKLTELGFHSEFMVGESVIGETPNQHAWILFKSSLDDEMLLETVSKDKNKMLYYKNSIQHIYIPWASIDNNFKFRIYGGYYSAIKRENNWTF